jgi:hypothetical protein
MGLGVPDSYRTALRHVESILTAYRTPGFTNKLLISGRSHAIKRKPP